MTAAATPGAAAAAALMCRLLLAALRKQQQLQQHAAIQRVSCHSLTVRLLEPCAGTATTEPARNRQQSSRSSKPAASVEGKSDTFAQQVQAPRVPQHCYINWRTQAKHSKTIQVTLVDQSHLQDT
jgi:hypothetical protein